MHFLNGFGVVSGAPFHNLLEKWTFFKTRLKSVGSGVGSMLRIQGSRPGSVSGFVSAFVSRVRIWIRIQDSYPGFVSAARIWIRFWIRIQDPFGGSHQHSYTDSYPRCIQDSCPGFVSKVRIRIRIWIRVEVALQGGSSGDQRSIPESITAQSGWAAATGAIKGSHFESAPIPLF